MYIFSNILLEKSKLQIEQLLSTKGFQDLLKEAEAQYKSASLTCPPVFSSTGWRKKGKGLPNASMITPFQY